MRWNNSSKCSHVRSDSKKKGEINLIENKDQIYGIDQTDPYEFLRKDITDAQNLLT